MSVTVEIPEGYYSLQLAGTKPVHLTGLYASDSGIGNQILLKSSPATFDDGQAWFISPSPVKTEINVYLITKFIPDQDTPGFTPDTDFAKVVLDVPKKWIFYPVQDFDMPIILCHSTGLK